MDNRVSLLTSGFKLLERHFPRCEDRDGLLRLIAAGLLIFPLCRSLDNVLSGFVLRNAEAKSNDHSDIV